MNKNQITMAAIGGVALVAALAVGYLAFSASGESGEKFDELEGKRAEISNLKGAAVAPCAESVKKIDENKAVLASWREQAFALAAKGDAAPAGETSPAAFKQRMVEDARELSRLPGGVDGAIVKPGFGFGFPSFINEGAMPKAEELATLDRQWSETCLLVKTLAGCGVSELVSIEPVQAKQEEAAPKEKRGGRGRKAPEKPKEIASAQSYSIKMNARPAAFVKVMNAIAEGDRFICIDNFSFTREDALGRILGEGKGKAGADEAAAPKESRRGRGRRGAQQADEQSEEKAEVAMKGLVTDPSTATLAITLDVTTFDFGSRPVAAAESAEGEKPEAAAQAAGTDDDEED